MSEEIVDRLKAEGQLIRNTGTNSIRAVRIQLNRFEDIFKTISENISSQTQMMASMLDISADQLKMSQETAEREEARRQREDLAADQTPTPRPDITRDDLPNTKTRESRGLFDLLSGGTGFLNKLLKGALFAGGIYALGNVFKGFIDAKIGENEFTKGLASAINWTAIGSIFGLKFGLLLGAGNILSNIFDLPEVTQKIGDAFDTEFTDNQAEGIGTALGAALTVAWLKKGGLRFKIIGALIVATELLGNNMKDWLIAEAGVDPDWANTTVDVTTLGLQGALIGGSIGGLPGAIAGALAGLAIGLGSKFINWLNNKRDEATQKFNEDVAAIEPLLEKAMRGETLTEEESRELARVYAKSQERFGPGRLPSSDENAAKAEETSRRIREAQGKRPLELEKGIIDKNQIKSRVLGALEGNQENLLELVRYLQEGRGIEDRDSIKRLLISRGNNVFYEMDELSAPQLVENLNKWEDLIEKSFDNNVFRRGTKGFQDFGPASFAILHGREAVVPEETPAGRFLNQFFTDNWLPKMAPSSDLADRVSTATGGAINMPVIVNNSPTVAPIVNNVQGGPNVTSTTVFGSGGSRSGTFGFSNAVN